MNTLPPEWQSVISERPSPPRQGLTRRRVGTSWRACPLSSVWDRATARGDHPLLQSVDRVASEWDRVVHRTPWGWLTRPHRGAPRFSAEDYVAVTAALGTDVLERTLVHIGLLRRRRRPRRSLAAIALLERVETAVATEMEVRRGPVCGTHGRDRRIE
jgi:hypothetical protein